MASQEPVIDKVNSEQFPAILEMLDKYLPPVFGDRYDGWRSQLETDFERGTKVAIGAWRNQELVGVVVFEKISSYFSSENTVELNTLLVDEEHRKNKLSIGAKLLDAFHYSLQRAGYMRVVVEARADQLLVPWLMSKGYKATYHHFEYGWLSYRLEIELRRIFADDRNDPNQVVRWVANELGIQDLRETSGLLLRFDGTIEVGSKQVKTNVQARISFCPDESVLKSFVTGDDMSSCVSFYIINAVIDTLSQEVREQVAKKNSTIIGAAKLKLLLGEDITPFACSLAEKQCLVVLIYPSFFEKLISFYSGKRFAYVGNTWFGELLSEQSRIIFVSNIDYSVLGGAVYLKHTFTDGPEATWDISEGLTIFQNNEEFRKWANIKRHMTVIECKNLVAMPEGSQMIPGPLDELKRDKWRYYPYDKYMKFYKEHLI